MSTQRQLCPHQSHLLEAQLDVSQSQIMHSGLLFSCQIIKVIT